MTNCLKGHWCGGRRRGLEPFGKRRKEFGEAKGRKAERAGASESNESLISPYLRFTILDLRSYALHRVNRISYIENFWHPCLCGKWRPRCQPVGLIRPIPSHHVFYQTNPTPKNRIPNKINMNLKILCHNDTQNKPKTDPF